MVDLPGYLPAFIASLLILVFIGTKDDINSLDSFRKLSGQFIAACVIVFFGGIKLPGLDGIFGISYFPSYFGDVFSIFAIIIAINAYNLIDGLDGLAGMISIVGAFVFGTWFFAGGHYPEAIISLSLMGALAGFIWYNFEPARIFMGDTGSQFLGLIMAVLGFRLVQLNAVTPGFTLNAPAVFIFSVMILPMFDTMRIIVIRLFNGSSPIKPDSKHLHHCLLNKGLSHSRIALILSFSSAVIIIASLFINSWNSNLSFVAVIALAALVLPVTSGVLMLNKIFTRRKAGRVVKMGRKVSDKSSLEKADLHYYRKKIYDLYNVERKEDHPLSVKRKEI